MTDYILTVTTATDRVATESRVSRLAAAEKLAKLFQRSGYYVAIHAVDASGKSERIGGVRKPERKG